MFLAVLFSIEVEVDTSASLSAGVEDEVEDEDEVRQADFGVFFRVSGFSEGRITSTAVPQIVRTDKDFRMSSWFPDVCFFFMFGF